MSGCNIGVIDYKRNILDFTAIQTDKMIMIGNIGIVTSSAGNTVNYPDLPFGRQPFQISVYCTKADMGQDFPCFIENCVRRRMILPAVKDTENNILLSGVSHLTIIVTITIIVNTSEKTGCPEN